MINNIVIIDFSKKILDLLGVCGDAFDMPSPRPNEYGGKYGQGVIVRSYAPGKDFTIRVELTASHQG